MSNDIQFLSAAARQPVPWKNGGGVTREVARDSRSREAPDFDWRVSIAEVALAGAFSSFPGCHRLIAIIRGEGMGFEAPGEPARMLSPRAVHSFSGEVDVSATLPFGPVTDLNLIYRPAAVKASMRFESGARRWRPASHQRVILLNVAASPLTGRANAQPMELGVLDGVLATSAAEIVVESIKLPYAVIEIEELERNGG
jgi:environmental stress-induced protein Ves